MKTIYTAVMARLKEQVPELKWIDLDTGQLEVRTERPALAYPAALIGITIQPKRNLTDKIQDCEATIIVRLAFDNLPGRTAANAPDAAREKSLSVYDTIADVYTTLQGFDTNNFDSLYRVRQMKENSVNGLFQYRIEFKTVFEDDTADN